MTIRSLALFTLCASLWCQGADKVEGLQKPEDPITSKVVDTFQLTLPAATAIGLVLPPLTTEAKRSLEASTEPNQIGISRKGDVQAQGTLDQSKTRWTQVTGGFATQLTIVSPGASALRVGIQFTRLPPEMEIRVAQQSPDGARQMVGRMIGWELTKLSGNSELIEYWTPSTDGQQQIIEFWSPRKPGNVEFQFVVVDVSHIFQRPFEPVLSKTLKFSCHVDIACIADSTVRTDGRAVARMVFIKNGAAFVCTGSLLNDRASSFTPLFATAHHCISTASVAATLETSWFYYPASCGGSSQALNRLAGGASLLLTDSDTDFTLLRLAQAAPGGAYFLGWNPAQLSPGEPIFGIHHPDGQSQRYSSGSFVVRAPVTDTATGVTFGRLFNRVLFTQGIVEGGSSGSPLLTSPYYFRGTLFGGPASNSCGSTTNIAGYSDFSAVYPLIDTYLNGPAVTDDYSDSSSAATLVSPNALFYGQINRVGDQDWFKFVFDSPGDWTVYSFDAMPGVRTDTIGEIYGSNGTTLLLSNDDRSVTDSNFLLSGRVSGAGTFYLRVTGDQGVVGRYGIRSTFVLPDDFGDAPATAGTLPLSGIASGFLGASSDQDWFRLVFNQAGVFSVYSFGSTDTIGRIYLSDGVSLVSESDDANPPDRNFALAVNISSPTTAYLKVTGFDGALGFYGLATSFTPASQPPANYTSLWWDPNESGWGINLTHQADAIFATLFTYAADRAGMWLSASLVQQSDGSFTGVLYRTSGPPYYQTPWTTPIVYSTAGTMTLRFNSATTGTMAYTFNGIAVNKSIQKMVFGSPVPTCTFGSGSRAGETNYQDLWWNSSESGWGINLTHQGNIIVATMFTYTATGRDGWFIASNLSRQFDGSFAGSLYSSSGPPFNTVPWTPNTLSTLGSMTLRFTDGEHGTLSFSVLGTNVSKSIQRLVFGQTVPVCR